MIISSTQLSLFIFEMGLLFGLQERVKLSLMFLSVHYVFDTRKFESFRIFGYTNFINPLIHAKDDELGFEKEWSS